MLKKGRGEMLPGLLIGFLTLSTVAAAQAQHPSPVDFQVIHLPRNGGSEVHYLAVRSQDEWLKVWQTGSLEPTLSGTPQLATASRPPPKIDFAHFILLIASTGVKPSSGYSDVFMSVDAISASMAGPKTSKQDVTTVHILELEPGNCPRMTELTGSAFYALIPQTTNEIRFAVTKADSNCSAP